MAGTSNSGGRNAKSRTMHLLQGTFRGDRHGAHDTPEPPKGTPDPPEPLAGVAKAEWQRMVERLQQTRALSVVDDAVVFQYAKLFAEVAETEDDKRRLRQEHAETRKLSLALKKAATKLEGQDLTDCVREIVKLRAVMADLLGLIARSNQQLRQGRMAIRMYLVECGLTPSARTRVKLPTPEKPKSKLEALLGGKSS